MVRMKTPTWLKGLVKGSSSSSSQGDQLGSKSSSHQRGFSLTRQSSSSRISNFFDNTVTPGSSPASTHAASASSLGVAPKRAASASSRQGNDNSNTGLNFMPTQTRKALTNEAKTIVNNLVKACNGPKNSPVSRTLGCFWTLMKEILEEYDADVSSVAVAALNAAYEFLKTSNSPAAWLQFALLVHTDKGVINRFSGDVEGAIVLICKHSQSNSNRGHESSPYEAILLDQWQRDLNNFKARCKEIWELYVYFVFLDTKGDAALLRMAARQLQAQLDTSEQGLVANLTHVHAQFWACSTLRFLADGKGLHLLERRHRQGLQEWHTALEAATESCAAAACAVVVEARATEVGPGVPAAQDESSIKQELHKQQAHRFWNHYFQTFKISWTDFAEAFQDCFCGGTCPQDLMDCLRSKLAKPSKHHMTLHAWETLLEKHNRGAPGLFQELVKEVLEDVPSCIYRQPASGADQDADVMHYFLRPRMGDPLAFQDSSGSQQALRCSAFAEASPPALAVAPKPPKSSTTVSMAPPGMLSVDGSEGVAKAPQAAGADDGILYPESVTPQDPRYVHGLAVPGSEMNWDEFVKKLFDCSRPWWAGPELWCGAPESQPEALQVEAIRRVKSSLVPTRKALILRVVSGQLSAGRPVLRVPRTAVAAASGKGLADIPELPKQPLPAIVITPNDNVVSCVTKFGRGPKEGGRKMPDMLMSEPIASRSHFEVKYIPQKDKYQVMDSGSKWGTFMKISREGQAVNCGDWIRIGNAELVVRFCGGGCKCAKRHAHHRLHAVNTAHSICGPNLSWSRILQPRQPSCMPWRRQWCFDEVTQVDDSDVKDADVAEMTSEVMGIMSGAYRMNRISGASYKAWPSTFEQLTVQVDASDAASKPGEKTRINSKAANAKSSQLELPAGPLELDFVSGHRPGERLVVSDRICTLGRGERCTIQLNDPQLANVSRTHCVFERVGNRWWLSDGGSTNGTWHRMSPELQPSPLRDLSTGETLLAGVHELKVEEAEMSRWCIPSPALAVLMEISADPAR